MLRIEGEPKNPVDIYAVVVKKKKNLVIGHLKKRKSGKYNNMISCPLKNDFSWCNVIIKGEPVSLENGEGMEVPCELLATSYKLCFKFLKRNL